MAEWLYEAGIGEARAALIEDGAIVEARIEPDDAAARVGTIMAARLVEITVRGREGRVTLDGGGEALLAPLPAGITQGAALKVEIVREAIPEPGRAKLARAMPVEAGAIVSPGLDLLARISATGDPVRHLRAHEPDLLEAAGWSEVLEEAATGEIAFAGGALRMTPAPAMTLFDVDGYPPLEALAVAAAHAVGAAILRHDIGGSIGIDFPTLEGKVARHAVAAAIDAALPLPFERTAMNGFGFLQIVRRRARASLPELLRADPAGAEARALLRAIERTPPPGARHHRVRPRVQAWLAAHPDLISELARRTGVQTDFEAS
ncbi:MAG: ribonuclease [Sphingomonas bacterium]|uniref:ribonuclease n=1 Tax=Sphingomonas bacterium TaxID=1895847 RepID=UPI00261DACD0|nr:ribonuclease [Sphingomonas bacterium]MDB5704080.1 ribonuclease [Sphingomonas bacterium]